MKSTIKSAALALAVFLASCGNEENTTTTEANVDTKSTMSAEPAGTDTNLSVTPASTGVSDQDFVTQASALNLAEVAAHKAAQTHATSADVKGHAKHMLFDHQKMGDEMKALATAKGLTVSAEPPADKKQLLDDMNASKKGKDWDAAYVAAQLKDHEDAIALFERGATSVKDAELKTMIEKALPTLRDHLAMVRDMQAKLPK